MDEVNILRNRTFNDELRTLVNRVSSHDKLQIDEPQNLSRNELIKAYHRLYYELKNLNDYNFIHSGFNPFLTEGGKEFSAGAYMAEYFKNTPFGEFAVFEYHLEHECFEVSFSAFDEIVSSAMVIGLSDNLYRDIMSGENGYLLNRDRVKNDKFLARKFLKSLEDDELSSLYFIPFSILTENLQPSLLMKKFTSHCSPVLMIKINSISESSELLKIRRDLEKSLSIPLFIYCDRAYEQLSWPTFQNLTYYVDYFYSIYALRGGGSAYIINTNRYMQREILMAMKYLCSRFYKTLCNESVVFRISVNRIIVFTVNSMIPVLDNIMNEWNILFENAFITDTKSISEIEQSDILLKDFFT